MKYKRFEELPVWKDAIELAVRTFDLTGRQVFEDTLVHGINLRTQSFPSQTILLRDLSVGRLRRR